MKLRSLILLIALAWASVAPGQALCRPGDPCYRPQTASSQFEPQPAIVQVVSKQDGQPWIGSGVLVPCAKSGVAHVLTAAHVIPPRPESVSIVFRGAHPPAPATIVSRDKTLDLALLAIPAPAITPYSIAASKPRLGDILWATGYEGITGRSEVVSGRLLHFATTDETILNIRADGEALMLAGSVSNGVSGGAIVNANGQLVGIVSATDYEGVFGTHCVEILKFLARAGAAPATGPVSPMIAMDVEETPPVEAPPTVADHLDKIRGLPAIEEPEGEESPTQVDPVEVVDANDQRVAEIQAGIAKAIDANDKRLAAIKARFEEAAAETRERMESIAARKSALELAVPSLFAALGWTGPPSVVALFAARFGWAAWRRRKARNASKPDAQPAQPVNDDYAEQLAGVYALSGRSPMSDVTLGREYDQELQQAASSSDGDLARWAGELRQRVANRLQRIHNPMPMAVEPIGA